MRQRRGKSERSTSTANGTSADSPRKAKIRSSSKAPRFDCWIWRSSAPFAPSMSTPYPPGLSPLICWAKEAFFSEAAVVEGRLSGVPRSR